ncbi:hypothetical protein J8281_15005 [Aquimarina sp. U1-2]|uniref:hypothetical protein n=1 Tax=Aquimarina sp. U1-2 TaxID=2823141 RepID=UPI001AEC747B|nr:hypothetical protein [Aquimarina sp. U1-2]MBP2833502.1 hypothetical protein [Aquimarina sp. U1-2]
MARTITEIQQIILTEKEKYVELDVLNSTSKTAIWRLWTFIISTAIWLHENIVERNALLSRPHTLNWYREQAFSYIPGADLIWKDGYFQFDTNGIGDVEAAKLIKYCSISERLFSDIFTDDQDVTQNTEELIKEYYYNQVGIVTIKVAKEEGGIPAQLTTGERLPFIAFMNEIKDAGTQLRIISTAGDKIRIVMEVYVDPLVIYTQGVNAGALISDSSIKPLEDVILSYLRNLEFNGAFVPTFLIDRVQSVPGVKLPLLRQVKIAAFNQDFSSGNTVYDDTDNRKETSFFVPTSGYFNTNFDTTNDEGIYITYYPYNLQTDPSFNI